MQKGGGALGVKTSKHLPLEYIRLLADFLLSTDFCVS